jgi:hypothetical protein
MNKNKVTSELYSEFPPFFNEPDYSKVYLSNQIAETLPLNSNTNEPSMTEDPIAVGRIRLCHDDSELTEMEPPSTLGK